ncbi:hypothetical protein CC85DRAFT_303523 [Cutaneotrichosporon oleaginosum]|uniref:Amino acid transporter n=1 Tax=Cutaneotrichosporon oleaginosum TaxID=879819 RepID=A0A0J0XJ40_9TREE|nr:uncharacterized protein CC85DRAFT_303523 [Cutaneotrichosporon oleaginosum]KLT41081.1 hypothetical protein CC85DRAFT_303523 [Cutaneotrichosporon oleaginosum]TXT05784.1 hypothetical protein COLE_07104 [Cutaneotrichosporon oleaginosum]
MPDPSNVSDIELSSQTTREAIPSGRLSDNERLRMLGYDAVLGRPLSFWGSVGMSMCYNSVQFEFPSYSLLYSYRAPLLFIIGYPFLALLHLTLIGPFAELVSTYPVAGGMATWAWQCARHGVRGERQWGWLVAGLTLAMHLGKTIAYLHLVTGLIVTMSAALYGAGGASAAASGTPVVKPPWAEPVLQLALVALAGLVCLTRLGRSKTFWMVMGSYVQCSILLWIILLIVMSTKLKSVPELKALVRPLDLGFPTRSQWLYSFSRMIFMSLPLRVTAMDCSIHMAEETQSPSRTVPRVLWLTSALHYVGFYVTMTLHILIVVPFTQEKFQDNPYIASSIILGMNKAQTIALSVVMTIPVVLQVMCSTIVTSRFIFALARDRGLPFSDLLVRTDKHRQPWVALVGVLLILCISVCGQAVPQKPYYTLLITVNFYFINIPYMIPLVLYILSHLDLRLVGRPEFNLGRFSRPLARIAVAWLIVSTIQGLLPLTDHAYKKGDSANNMSYLPIFIGCMLLIMLVTWFLYGKRHYSGPIRALTIWATGTDIDPRNVATAPRGQAIREYIERKTGQPAPTTPKYPARTASGPRSPETPRSSRTKSSFHRLVGRSRDSGKTSPLASQGASDSPTRRNSVNPESGVLPRTECSVIPESGLLPESRHQTTTLNAIPESELLPETRLYDTTISVIPESGVLPETTTATFSLQRIPVPEGPFNRYSFDEREIMSAAQAESQLFPDPPRRASRTITPRSPPPPWRGSRNLSFNNYEERL